MFPLNLCHGVATYDDNQETQISFPSNPLISHDLMINWKHICSINNNNKDLISLDQIKKKMEFQLSQNRSFIVLRGEPHAMTPHSLSTLPQLTSHVTNHSTGFPLVANEFTKFTHSTTCCSFVGRIISCGLTELSSPSPNPEGAITSNRPIRRPNLFP